MTAAEERASERLRELEQTHAEAATLARYASLATRVDAALLRRLRLHLVQRANASAEADLWFSDLSESRDGESLVLDPGVAALLREQLADERLPDGTPALDAAFAHTRDAHRSWPASLQLEEELVYLALRDGAAAAPAIEQLLRPAIAAMAASAQRGIEMSRWVLRAMPRMPAVVRETDAAAAMIVAAIAYLGPGSHVLTGLERRGLPTDLSWLLPPAALARRTALVCDVRANAVIFRARLADESEAVIEVPDTRPIVLEVRWWTDAVSTGSRVVAVEPGAPVLLPSSWRQLELQTLSGEVYQIERTSPPKPASKGDSIDIDALISYAHLDNAALVEGKDGWVKNFHRGLEVRLGQLLGREARIWFDPKLSGSDLFADETAERIRRVAALIAVVSPRYVASEWCRRELDEFTNATGGVRVGDKSRIFKVMKTPVPLDRMPRPLSQLLGYEFFSVDADTGRTREFTPIFGPESERLYWMKLDDLAHDIAGLLPIVESGSTPDLQDPSPRVVYLAETSADLQSQREAIRRELQSEAYVVLPDGRLPLIAEELAQSVREQLDRSQFSVHLVGQNYGFVPEGANDSIVVLQHEMASDRAMRGDFYRLIWMPPNLKVSDPRQQAFVDRLKAGSGTDDVTEVLTGTLEELRSDLHLRLHPPHSQIPDPSADPSAGLKEIYLICDRRDLEQARSLRDVLFDRGYEVTLPVFDGDPAELREHHEENLRSCDGALIYYGTGNEMWLRTQLREVQKMPGKGRTKPAPATAVYIAPPVTPEKARFRTHQAIVIAGADGPTAGALAPFLEKLRDSE